MKFIRLLSLAAMIGFPVFWGVRAFFLARSKFTARDHRVKVEESGRQSELSTLEQQAALSDLKHQIEIEELQQRL